VDGRCGVSYLFNFFDGADGVAVAATAFVVGVGAFGVEGKAGDEEALGALALPRVEIALGVA